LAACLACGQAFESAPPDASAPVDATSPTDGPSGDDASPEAAPNKLTVGVSTTTAYAGTLASVTATPSGDPGPFNYAWSITAKPPGSLVTPGASTATTVATIRPDLVGDYTLEVHVSSPNGVALATTTIHAIPAPVFFLRTTMNASGGLLDVHVAGHDGSG